MARMRPVMPAAVVIGLDSITALQTARILAGRGVPVVGIAADPHHPSCWTRACAQRVFAATSGEGLVETLWRLADGFADPPVLFPCTDLSVLTLSQHRELLGSRYRSVLPPQGVIETLLDKARFAEHAGAAGLPIPATFVLRGRADAVAASRQLRFPCVLKPGVKGLRWLRHTTAKLFRVGDAQELLQVYDTCAPWTEALVAQEWIEGGITSHVTCNAYFDAASVPVATFVTQKLRHWPLEGGIGCFSQECRNDEVVRETVRLFQGVAYHGLAYLEMKRDDRTGRHLIVEPNVGRPTGRSAAADLSGVELLYTQYCDALGWPLPPRREQQYGGAKWIYLRQDCQAAFGYWRRGMLRPLDWLRSLRGCRRDAVFAWRDPVPFLADLVRTLGKTIRRWPDPPAVTTFTHHSTPEEATRG